jgi:hypothetical protein
MKIGQLFRWRHTGKAPRCQPTKARIQRTSLQLEALEERTVLSAMDGFSTPPPQASPVALLNAAHSSIGPWETVMVLSVMNDLLLEVPLTTALAQNLMAELPSAQSRQLLPYYKQMLSLDAELISTVYPEMLEALAPVLS